MIATCEPSEPCAQCRLEHNVSTAQSTAVLLDRSSNVVSHDDSGFRKRLLFSCLVAATVVLAGFRVPAATADNGAYTSPKSDEVLQEIVVTATRRTENLSRVPQSIAVFDAADWMLAEFAQLQT